MRPVTNLAGLWDVDMRHAYLQGTPAIGRGNAIKDFHPFLVHPKMVSLVVFEKNLEIKQFFAKMML